MKHRIALLGGTATLILLSGCASSPPQPDEALEQARAEVRTLADEPLAQQAAADDLRAAQQRLQDAEAAQQSRRPQPVVDHLAYLARRHAEAGEERVAAMRAQQQLARAQEERNRALLAQRAREAQDQAASAQAQLAATQAQLAELQAKQTARGTVITLGDVLFDTGQATLKPGADLTLDRLAHYLRDHPDTRILIEGHTDSRGSDAYNDALSERRADAVEHALRSRGVSPDAMRAVGRGKAYPVASNDTDAGRQQNRRVEIIFSDNAGRFAQDDSGAPVQR